MQMKDLVFQSLETKWDSFSEVMLAMNFGVMLRSKGPYNQEFARDIVCIHSLLICLDLIEYTIIGDTKAPLLRRFLFILKFKAGDFRTTGQYKNSQTFSELQFRPLPKNPFHSIRLDLTDTSGEKHLCICRYHSFCFDV